MPKRKRTRIEMPKRTLDTLQRYSIPEAKDFLRISRSSLYLLIESGNVFTIKEGKRIFIPGSEIARLSAAPCARATEQPATTA